MKEVFDFLKSFEFWQSLIYVAVIFIILLIFIAVTKPNIKLFNFSLCFFNKKSDLALFLQFKREVEKKIYFIEYIGITKAQMKKVDIMLGRVKEMLMQSYTDLISSEIPEPEITTHTDYLSYAAHVEVMLFLRIRDKVREIILDEENPIPEVSSESFEKFVQDTSQSWYECGKDYMDLFYGKGHVISRDVLKDSTYELMPEFERCSREVLRDVKNIDIDMKKKIEELKDQVRKKELAILGIVLT